ncbi:uncharacterized protein LOC114269649 [Camellia sinensis]|uniref:uncharacterized protein LOC114269649 n=1 Tax=Camellia sinensis TaxID=4442 RepID=UPI0010356676|nr:uncharacterized protein LOC114269649 [Camellia sinensis]
MFRDETTTAALSSLSPTLLPHRCCAPSSPILPLSLTHPTAIAHPLFLSGIAAATPLSLTVIIKVRPLSSSEISLQGYSRCVRQDSCQTITWTGHPESRFTFDVVADENVSQTGSGKTQCLGTLKGAPKDVVSIVG